MTILQQFFTKVLSTLASRQIEANQSLIKIT